MAYEIRFSGLIFSLAERLADGFFMAMIEGRIKGPATLWQTVPGLPGMEGVGGYLEPEFLARRHSQGGTGFSSAYRATTA